MLYEKYKPKKFIDIVGQDIATSILTNIAINYDKYKIHGIILSGPYGCGKTICATIFAHMINCHEICGNCDFCRVKNDIHSDIIIFNAALNSGIDHVRQLIERIQYPPLVFKYRVIIMEEAHMLSKESMDVLLLTLQDPPLNTIFIFTTTNLHKITNTLRSRCLLVHINTISNEILFNEIKRIGIIENIIFDDVILRNIAIASNSSLRQALSNLETIHLSKLSNINDINKYLSILSPMIIENIFIELMRGDIKSAWKIWTNIKDGYSDKALLLAFETLFNELRCWINDMPYNISDILITDAFKNILTNSLLLHFIEILHHCLIMNNYQCQHIIQTFFYMITHVEDTAMIHSIIHNTHKVKTELSTNYSDLIF